MKIPFYIESINGHDTKLVTEDNVVDEVNKQVNDGKWVTVEKKDGSTEMITKPIKEDDLDDEDKALVQELSKKETPKQEDKPVEEPKSNWKDTFGNKTQSVTSTNKMKGG